MKRAKPWMYMDVKSTEKENMGFLVRSQQSNLKDPKKDSGPGPNDSSPPLEAIPIKKVMFGQEIEASTNKKEKVISPEKKVSVTSVSHNYEKSLEKKKKDVSEQAKVKISKNDGAIKISINSKKKAETPLKEDRKLLSSSATEKDEKRKRTKSSQPEIKSAKSVIERHTRSKSEGNYAKFIPLNKQENEVVIDNKDATLPDVVNETIQTKPEESRIPTRNSKKSAVKYANKIDHTLEQMGTLKTRLRIELKSKSNKHPMEQLNLENFDFQDENAIREKIIETHRNNIILKKQVTELNSHNSTLQNRLLKEQEKSKLNPKITMGVPTSVEANMHLRYQFQTYLEKERKKYAQLLQENERLVLEVKDANLENLKKRKAQTLEISLTHNNEIANWKAKVKDLELDNMQLLEIITKREQELAKVAKEKESIYNEMVRMRRLHMHLSNIIEDDMVPKVHSSSSQELDSTKKENLEKIKPEKYVPHYAKKIVRQTEVKIREGNKKLLSSKYSEKKQTIPAQEKLVNSIKRESVVENESANLNDVQFESHLDQGAKNISKNKSLNDENQDLSIKENTQPVTPQTKHKFSKPNQLNNAEDFEKERTSSVTKKEKLMKNAKIQIEYESYVGDEKNNENPESSAISVTLEE